MFTQRLTLPPDAKPFRAHPSKPSEHPLELVLTQHGTKVSNPTHDASLHHSTHSSHTLRSPLPDWLQRASRPLDRAPHSLSRPRPDYPRFSRPIPRRPFRRSLATITSSLSEVNPRISTRQIENSASVEPLIFTRSPTALNPSHYHHLEPKLDHDHRPFESLNRLDRSQADDWKLYHQDLDTSPTFQALLNQRPTPLLQFSSSPVLTPHDGLMQQEEETFDKSLTSIARLQENQAVIDPRFLTRWGEPTSWEEEINAVYSHELEPTLALQRPPSSSLGLESPFLDMNSPDDYQEDRYLHQHPNATEQAYDACLVYRNSVPHLTPSITSSVSVDLRPALRERSLLPYSWDPPSPLAQDWYQSPILEISYSDHLTEHTAPEEPYQTEDRLCDVWDPTVYHEPRPQIEIENLCSGSEAREEEERGGLGEEELRFWQAKINPIDRSQSLELDIESQCSGSEPGKGSGRSSSEEDLYRYMWEEKIDGRDGIERIAKRGAEDEIEDRDRSRFKTHHLFQGGESDEEQRAVIEELCALTGVSEEEIECSSMDRRWDEVEEEQTLDSSSPGFKIWHDE